MSIEYTPLNPPLIPNTDMQVGTENGTVVRYKIQAKPGYLMHDKRIDEPVFDPETMEETGEIIPWFRRDMTAVGGSYNFDNVTPGTYQGIHNVLSVLKVGENEFYTVPESEVPTTSILKDDNHQTA